MAETQAGSTNSSKATTKQAEAAIAQKRADEKAKKTAAQAESPDSAAKTKLGSLKQTVAKDVEIARKKAQELGKVAVEAVKKVDKTKARALGKQALEQADHAKESGKVAAKNALDVVLGRRESPMLKFLVIGLRLIGIALFVLSLFGMWLFSPMLAAIGWIATSVTGFALGFIVFGMGELVNLLIKIEGHLHALALSQRH